MFKNKGNTEKIMVLMVFTIFVISCLTLVDSVTAIAIDSNQELYIDSDLELNNESIDFVEEEPIEGISTYLTFQNIATNNESENIQRNAENIMNKTSKNDDLANKENNKNNNIEKTSVQKNLVKARVNPVTAEENITTNSSNNESAVAANNQKIDPINKDFNMDTQYIGILLTLILFIASFSSFILYLKS